jgi:hypothetical protein
MNNTSRALTTLSLGVATLLGALAVPASAEPIPGLGVPELGLSGLAVDICKSLHGIPIAGAVGDVTCVADGLPVLGSSLTPVIGPAAK